MLKPSDSHPLPWLTYHLPSGALEIRAANGEPVLFLIDGEGRDHNADFIISQANAALDYVPELDNGGRAS